MVVCPTAYIHAPWTMPVAEQDALHFHIGVDYPAPSSTRRQGDWQPCPCPTLQAASEQKEQS
ncbi:FAD-binding domain-containing protein [Spirosoma rhododendri]|uniref:FAD-binding domain-containing protein n=1 Tax=Spirosoma rhododendri TaxID=2728024 RepID=UPI0020C43C59|nr:FAD-binding domain-containing protein [Spirosoma rhododendri]